MAKTLDSSVIDGSLNVVKNGATQMCLCSAQPTTYAQAVTTYMLAIKTGLTSGSFTGPAAGDVSGRKLTKNAETGISVTNTGTVLFVAFCTASLLLFVDTVTSQVVTAGNTMNTPAFKWEIADPT
jgi:hypothetical protein